VDLDIRSGVPLAPLTTLETGGPARYFIEAESDDVARAAAEWARSRGLPTYVLGGGSNVLVSDAGLDGLVIRMRTRGVTIRRDSAAGDHVRAHVAAGEEWDTFVRTAVDAGLAGVECLSGIPGSVGAAPIQNIGAYGQEASDTIADVTVLDLATFERGTIDAAACSFGYRDSRFRRDPGAHIVLGVSFRLANAAPSPPTYPEIVRELGDSSASLRSIREAVLRVRRRKSMVLDHSDENRRSVGSFFTNPVVSGDEADRVALEAERTGVPDPASMPRYTAEHGGLKLSAAWLVENAGFPRGTHEGNVGISTRHTLALVNLGKATTSEVLAFASAVRDKVKETFGVALEIEPVCLGCAPPWRDGCEQVTPGPSV
jgi:UDP-N-acetylmuramate dehydrogenase